MPAYQAATPTVPLWATMANHLPAFIGPLLGAHAALALVKLNAKLAYVNYLFYDPLGASTYLAIRVAKSLPTPDLLIPLPQLRWLALACFALGTTAGICEAWRRWAWREPDGVAAGYGISFALVSVLLGATLVHWLF
ncbi:MAG: hypothetical protein P1P84_19650 [Deferrisomatales bacterium]|nr:hypothetical protein [Deferrisomatales bacterium]